MKIFSKTPSAVIRRTFNWAQWLGSDTIQTSTMIIDAGLTQQSVAHDATTATVVVSGGTAGQRLYITNRIATAGGLTEERTMLIHIVEHKST